MISSPELMMFVSLFFLLLLTDGASSEENCTYQAVIKHLGLTYDNLFHMTRPVTHHKERTYVYLELRVYAILEVREKDQKFVPYIWITLEWDNEFLEWDPDQFCGIEDFSVPAEIMWKPDLSIEEMTEKYKSSPNSYVTITYDGFVTLKDNLVLVSTCRMQVYRFPFDTQSCNLTFKSFVYSDDDILLTYPRNTSEITAESLKVMQNQSEWQIISIAANKSPVNNDGYNQSLIIYTIKIRRNSVLYVVNFILPILFFLCLDLASFLISDTSGEKLGFKVTVLLAVTVMQLILYEILPSSSTKIPLIAIYCIGIFALMMLSLLESILVTYLRNKDNTPQDNETDEDLRLSEDKRDKTKTKNPIKTPSEILPVAKEDSNIQLMEVSLAMDELRNLIKTLTLLHSSRKEEAKPGYWTRVAKRMNKVYFIFYVLAVILFLVYMFVHWTNENE